MNGVIIIMMYTGFLREPKKSIILGTVFGRNSKNVFDTYNTERSKHVLRESLCSSFNSSLEEPT